MWRERTFNEKAIDRVRLHHQLSFLKRCNIGLVYHVRCMIRLLAFSCNWLASWVRCTFHLATAYYFLFVPIHIATSKKYCDLLTMIKLAPKIVAERTISLQRLGLSLQSSFKELAIYQFCIIRDSKEAAMLWRSLWSTRYLNRLLKSSPGPTLWSIVAKPTSLHNLSYKIETLRCPMALF